MFEINLVPDIKREMLKAQRIRNIVLFVCIALSATALIVVLILLGIKGGQDIAMTNQDNELKAMSAKVHEFDNLDQFITIQDQLKKLSTISENKKAASRLFGILTAIQPVNDQVTYSELKLDLTENTLTLEGQANAGPNTDGINYRALEAYRKGIELTTYDYGNYVDKEGAEIPYYCVEEFDSEGHAFKENDAYYGNWYINRTDCNPSEQKVENSDKNYSIKIWRTPQFSEWYSKKYITLDGAISGIEHFESQCITYSGSDDGKKWTSSNETCKLTENGLNITESSNGLNESDNLVLRFAGSMTIQPQALLLANRHMQFIGPAGQNVTDSYTQVKNMFEKRAADCDKNDSTCQQNNQSGGSNG